MRLVWIREPRSVPLGEKRSHVSLPKRDELLLRIVFAFPKASRTYDACSVHRSTLAITARFAAPSPGERGDARSPPSPVDARRVADDASEMYRISWRHDSVLPAPDSPLTTSACAATPCRSSAYARSATAKMCGGPSAPPALPCSCMYAGTSYSRSIWRYGLSDSRISPLHV